MTDQEHRHLADLGFNEDTIELLDTLKLDHLGPCPDKDLPSFVGKQGSNVTLFTQTETVRQFICVIDPKDGTEGVMWAIYEAGRADRQREIATVWEQFNRLCKPR